MNTLQAQENTIFSFSYLEEASETFDLVLLLVFSFENMRYFAFLNYYLIKNQL